MPGNSVGGHSSQIAPTVGRTGALSPVADTARRAGIWSSQLTCHRAPGCVHQQRNVYLGTNWLQVSFGGSTISMTQSPQSRSLAGYAPEHCPGNCKFGTMSDEMGTMKARSRPG
jgi:hypothetical protein